MTSETESISPVALGDRLGAGCFGEVFRGTQAPHGAVAVKIIDCQQMREELGIDEWKALRDHLQREAENLRKAESEHVVRVHGVGATSGQDALHIVTELCDGSLLSLCEKGPIATQRVRRAIADALHGLETLHARAMVHRDLKPGNLLYVGTKTKLADFGLVSDEIVNGYASLNGYTEHLAPEVHRNFSTSPRSDVWAMGLTIFRLVNGEPWYREEKQRLGLIGAGRDADLAATIAAVTAGGFAPSLRWLPHVHDAVRRFVRRAMHDNPVERFSDGGEMLTHFTRSVLGLREPTWTCSYTDAVVLWTSPAGEDRNLVVEWRRVNARRHCITARSEPAGRTGRARTFLAEDDIAPSLAVRQLEAFFAGRVKT